MRTMAGLAALGAAMVLSGCGGGGGGGGVQAPSQVVGTWGADCASPFVKFDGGKITVFPDNASYALTGATLAGNQLTVAYKGAEGPVSEVYVLEGATLRLDHGTYSGSEATWHKAPMNKCQ